MRRRTAYSVRALLLVVIGLGSDARKEYGDWAEVVGIEGTWRLVAIEEQGEKKKPNPEAVKTNYYRSGTFTYDADGSDPWRGTYRIDATHNPPQLNEYFETGSPKGLTHKYVIYHLDGDTLRIGHLGSIIDPGYITHIFVFKRVK